MNRVDSIQVSGIWVIGLNLTSGSSSVPVIQCQAISIPDLEVAARAQKAGKDPEKFLEMEKKAVKEEALVEFKDKLLGFITRKVWEKEISSNERDEYLSAGWRIIAEAPSYLRMEFPFDSYEVLSVETIRKFNGRI